jgi:regulator of protease activity HflC (stomatin/prohibitin superfamily)
MSLLLFFLLARGFLYLVLAVIQFRRNCFRLAWAVVKNSALGMTLALLSQVPVVVQDGTVGVRVFLNSAEPKALKPGLYATWPIFGRVVPMSTRLINIKVTADAASSDTQQIHTLISVAYCQTEVMAPQTYTFIGDMAKVNAIIGENAVPESLKAVTAQYTADQIITQRDKVKNEIAERIQSYVDRTLLAQGIPGAVKILNVSVHDFDFNPDFDKSIEQKVKAEQESLAAQSKKAEVVARAEARRDADILLAKAEADRRRRKEEAEANALSRESAAISENPAVLALRIIEQWKGGVPKYRSGNAGGLQLDIVTDK